MKTICGHVGSLLFLLVQVKKPRVPPRFDELTNLIDAMLSFILTAHKL